MQNIVPVLWIVLSALVGFATLMSGVSKLKGVEQVTTMLTKVGLSASQIKTLGVIGVLAGLGVAVGLISLFFAPDVAVLAVVTTALLTVYYFGAVIAHLRVRDFAPVPPIVLMLLSGAATWLGAIALGQ